MKKTDLQVGMVVEIREGKLYMLMYNDNYDLILSNTNSWMQFNNFNNDLTSCFFKKHDIMKVYGFTDCHTNATIVSTDRRKLLWERKEDKKKMTVSEVESILGYGIEIISEK